MNDEQWARAQEVLQAAWERDAGERSLFLDQACVGNPELRRLVEALLATDEKAGDFLETPVMKLADVKLADAGLKEERPEDSGLVGTRVGRYTIQGLIGKGGMGAVYRAVRVDDFRMQVAIKLLKRGTDTEAALGRFRAERQMLAGLQHPNIAHVLDGGATESGLPYFVMEYVDGTPLLEYAAPLGVRQRLELFRSVCSAVQYAHEKQIVHRDIKPANILVTTEGVPKLLDFGIAKMLDPAADGATAALTMTGARLMTPDYASPEQVRGEPVTPATDVYSLGAVLYELVTGERAHRIQTYSVGEIEKEICFGEPKKPSAVAKALDPDLDNIVLKAIRKEPDRRFASAEDLSADLERFLKDLPIQARPESLPYRGRKFVKRHRSPVIAALLSVVVMLAFIAGLNQFRKSGGTKPPSKRSTSQRWDRLTFEKIASLGDPAPGGGSYTTYFQPWALNNGGDLTFASQVSAGSGDAVFLSRKEARPSVVAVARPGAPAPGGSVFEGDLFGYASLNDSGDVAFSTGVKPLAPPELKGFEKGGLYRYSHLDGKLSAVVIPGVTAAPGFGVFQSTNQHATLNNRGEIVFVGVVRTTAGISTTGISTRQGLGAGVFLADRDGHISKLAAPGDPAPGGGHLADAYNTWINDQGDVVFGGHVAGEKCMPVGFGGCGESVYFKSAGRALQSIAHQGEQAAQGGTYAYAWGALLNNRGDIAFIGVLNAQPRSQDAGIFLRSHGVTEVIAKPGDLMPDGRKVVQVNPATVIGNYSLNNRGVVCFNASLENRESAFYVYSEGELFLVAGTGSVIPGLGTVSSVINFVNGGILNDSGQILFSAMLTDGRGVLLLATPPPLPANSKRQ